MIVQRLEGPTRTIFEHDDYVSMRGKFVGKQNYDIALIRLTEPLDIPVNTYNNEPINSICLFSVDRFIPKTGCLNSIYFSGFGTKGNDKAVRDDPGQNLTYLKMFRASTNLCTLALGEMVVHTT